MDKIKTIDELKEITIQNKRKNKKVVLCHGCFDLFHIGHLRHLKAAKKLGDILVVTLTPDRYVNKGKGRPAFTQEYRAEMLSAIDIIDYVSINEWPSAVNTLYKIQPDFFVKGSDYKKNDGINLNFYKEEETCQKLNIQLKFTDEITSSSTKLINTYFSLV